MKVAQTQSQPQSQSHMLSSLLTAAQSQATGIVGKVAHNLGLSGKKVSAFIMNREVLKQNTPQNVFSSEKGLMDV